MSTLEKSLQPLHDAERRLVAAVGVRASLDPTRSQATSLPALGERMFGEVSDPSQWALHGRSLALLALAQLEHFPENIFWDLDYPALCVVRAARLHPTGVEAYLTRYTSLMTGLHAAYGRHSAIRYRYVHDFIYGFDWERWVGAGPRARAGTGPFDLPFLERALERSHEIERAIREGDPDYPRLEPGQFRNPFGFSREPEAELRLHRVLLARDGIPVRSFDPDAQPRADCGGSRLRKALAAELGLNVQP